MPIFVSWAEVIMVCFELIGFSTVIALWLKRH